jgi:member of the syntaxin family of t-SNAREs
MRIRSLAFTAPPNSSSPSPELASARSDLESSLSLLAEDLADLVESVKAVEKDPYKYGLEIEEVARRKRLVGEVGGEVEDMREELLKPFERGQSQGGGKGAALTAMDGDRQGEDAHSGAYEEFEQQQQVRIMHEQDQQLDGVFRTVGNLRQQADDMGRELEEQQEMLEHVETLADRVGGRLQTGVQKLGAVVKRNEDKWSSCCIGFLILVLIILLILVIAL